MCMCICICTCIVHMHMHMHMHMHIYICISAHAGDDGGAATAGGSRGEWPPLRRAAHAGVTVRACVFVCVFVCIHACACDGKCNLPNACVYVYVICVCVCTVQVGLLLPLSVTGFVWGVLYVGSGNLLVPILIHALWNTRVFLGSYLGL